jgi:hypothetical protein
MADTSVTNDATNSSLQGIYDSNFSHVGLDTSVAYFPKVQFGTYGSYLGYDYLNLVYSFNARDASACYAFLINSTEIMRMISSGNVGIGTTAPTALLNIKAGTATAHTQPLQFTPTGAVLLTTPELGSVEVDSTSLYYTAVGTLRENIHFGSKGSRTLTAGTTSTITDAIAKTTSIIIIQPTSAAITLLGVYVSTKNNGSFVLTHGVAAGTESFDWVIIN